MTSPILFNEELAAILDLFEDAALFEATITLTKGSQRILNDKGLVANLAKTLRNDIEVRPQSFRPEVRDYIARGNDQQLAMWFLASLDKIERTGYEGMIYSRDGVNSDWITRLYIAGRSDWEDISGNLNMILRDWYLLKNRNLLEPMHNDLQRFTSIRQLGDIVTRHYAEQLDELRDKAANAARTKMARSLLIVDNDDYKIYIPLNRTAGVLLGDKAKWCTANAEYDGNFHSYSDRAMLFILLPYIRDESGKKTHAKQEIVVQQGERAGATIKAIEKYQFDAGSRDFVGLTNYTVNPPSVIAERFPYLYTDIKKALNEKKDDIIEIVDKCVNDETINKHKDHAIKKYDIDKEIAKLRVFVNSGYFTEKVRPAVSPEAPAEAPPAGADQQPNQPGPPAIQEAIMADIDKDVAAMLNSLKKYDKLVESVAPVLMARPAIVEKEDKKMPPWLKDKKEGSDDEGKKGPKKPSKKDAEKVDEKACVEEEDDKEDLEESADKDVLAWMGRFAKLGNMKGYGK